MARNDKLRYEQALAYIKGVDAGLETDIKTKIGLQIAQKKKRVEDIGRELSLGGSGYSRSGSGAQHTAVRALLLCQVAYFRGPHSWFDFAQPELLKTTRTKFHGKPESDVVTAIKYFIPGDELTLDGLACAAEEICESTGSENQLWRVSEDKNLSTMTICYTGVAVWLFASRFVSRRWFIKKLDANSANDMIGRGILVEAKDWGNIPRGWIWNIQRKGDPTTCHWGISLGNGMAAATNNTGKSDYAKVEYLNKGGGKLYGTFQFTKICEVLNGCVNYGHAGDTKPTKENIAVYRINPMGNNKFY